MSPGQEFQQCQQEPNAEAHTQEDEDRLQVLWLQGFRSMGPVRADTTAGPPLVPQVGQLTGLAELQDGNGKVLNQWRTWMSRGSGIYLNPSCDSQSLHIICSVTHNRILVQGELLSILRIPGS